MNTTENQQLNNNNQGNDKQKWIVEVYEGGSSKRGLVLPFDLPKETHSWTTEELQEKLAPYKKVSFEISKTDPYSEKLEGKWIYLNVEGKPHVAHVQALK